MEIEPERIVEQIPLSRVLVKAFGWEETRDKDNSLVYVKDGVLLYYTPELDKDGFQIILKPDPGFGPYFIFTVEDLFDHYKYTTGKPLILPAN